MIQSFLTFDSMDRTLSVTIHWNAVEQYVTVTVLINLTQFVILELALSKIKRLTALIQRNAYIEFLGDSQQLKHQS